MRLRVQALRFAVRTLVLGAEFHFEEFSQLASNLFFDPADRPRDI
jgi:hypothetical protein